MQREKRNFQTAHDYIFVWVYACMKVCMYACMSKKRCSYATSGHLAYTCVRTYIHNTPQHTQLRVSASRYFMLVYIHKHAYTYIFTYKHNPNTHAHKQTHYNQSVTHLRKHQCAYPTSRHTNPRCKCSTSVEPHAYNLCICTCVCMYAHTRVCMQVCVCMYVDAPIPVASVCDVC